MPSCIQPIFIKDPKTSRIAINPKYNLVPCGKCKNCLTARSSAWGFRLMQEEKVSTSSQFITLTYATQHLPITRNEYGTIKKRDLQLFFKRLRKLNKNNSIKYYAVGEYGGKLKRPHYHIILFNAGLGTIQAAWNQGHVHYGNVTGASVGYTLKYISKPYKNFKLNDDREKPFSLMSKGLGESYIKKMEHWHKADTVNRMYCNLPDGKKCTMPRYYKERIYSDQDREAIQKASRLKFAELILNDILKYSGEQIDKSLSNRRAAKDHSRRIQMQESGIDETKRTFKQNLQNAKKISYATKN